MAPSRKFDPFQQLDQDKARKQARLNKQRADRMERDVAAYLTRGRLQIARRTPQSGAGWIKGDNHVPLPSAPDFFLISCKMSQAQDEENNAYIKFHGKWIDELKRDTAAMRSIGCKFGIMVLRWFGRAKGELIAFVDVEDLKTIENVINFKINYNSEKVLTFRKKNGDDVKGPKIYRSLVLDNLHSVFIIDGIRLVPLHLSEFHEALLEYDRAYDEGKFL